MAIIGIIAISKNFAIGRRGKLPWHYSEDLKFFKRTTMDNAIVMGSRTWLSLNGPLRTRKYRPDPLGNTYAARRRAANVGR